MKSYREMSNEELKAEIDVLMKEYRQYQNMDLKLNMSRGKPCLDQLDHVSVDGHTAFLSLIPEHLLNPLPTLEADVDLLSILFFVPQ